MSIFSASSLLRLCWTKKSSFSKISPPPPRQWSCHEASGKNNNDGLFISEAQEYVQCVMCTLLLHTEILRSVGRGTCSWVNITCGWYLIWLKKLTMHCKFTLKWWRSLLNSFSTYVLKIYPPPFFPDFLFWWWRICVLHIITIFK